MKEQGPMVQQDRLTIQSNLPTLKIGGNIFMDPNSEGPRGATATAPRTPEEVDAHLRRIAEGREGTEPISNRDQAERESNRRVSQFNEILQKPDVVLELKKEHPDFSVDSLADLREFVDKLDVSNREEYLYIAMRAANLNTDVHSGNRADTNIISESSRRLLYEALYEKLVGRPDTGSEEAHYSLGSYEMDILRVSLDTLAVREFKEKIEGDEKPFYVYLQELAHMRQVMHDLNINLHYGEQYKEFVLQHMKSAGLDFVQNELSGVASVVRLYEKVSANKVSEKREWLDHGDLKGIDGEVEKIFLGSAAEKEGRPLTDWEKKRAIRLGRIFFAGTQRQAMYAALGNIPSTLATTDRIGSIPYEYMGRSLVPLKMIAARFFVSDKQGPKELLKMVFEEQAEKEKNFMSLFGIDPRIMMLNSYGATDPESHSWRVKLMFFGNIKLDIDGRSVTLLDYLNAEAEKGYEKESGDPLLGGGEIKSKEDKRKYSETVEDKILGQRLYLSVLHRNGDFSEELKTKIWQKIAMLKPSTIASIAPGVITNKGAWNKLRLKLYAAEERRVVEDSKRYKEGPLTSEYLTNEKDAFENALNIVSSGGILGSEDQFNSVLDYTGLSFSEPLDADEIEVLRDLIVNGVKKAAELGKAKMPFTFAIDDAPVIAWKKTGESNSGLSDADVIRILASDQTALKEGWDQMSTFLESPHVDAIKHIAEAVEKIGSVHGRPTAQDAVEPFIVALMKMMETPEGLLFIPGGKTALRMMNKPTSLMEKYYRNSYSSMDAREKADFLQALSQAKAIADNTADPKEGMLTQLDVIRKKTRSSRMWVMLTLARTIIYLIGPVAGYEFLRIMIPTPGAKH